MKASVKVIEQKKMPQQNLRTIFIQLKILGY